MFVTDSILPADPEGVEVLHDREYRVRAFRLAESSRPAGPASASERAGDGVWGRSPHGDAAQDRLLIRGAVRDQKPPGMYVPEDRAPLTIHHMVVELEIDFPALEIVRAEATLEIHPHTTCPRIEDHYEHLVGLSISRGFTNKVRELFGGPRGCTHTTALIQAMAPVAVQCFWSMRASTARRTGLDRPFAPAADGQDGESAEAAWKYNVGSCHVWVANGEHVAQIQRGEEVEVPLPIQRRMVELGHEPSTWRPGAS